MQKDIILLSEILAPYHFVKRGQAFFRVHGDGVLQMIKLEKEPQGISLGIGFRSLYSEISKHEFSSLGCAPQYSVHDLFPDCPLVPFRLLALSSGDETLCPLGYDVSSQLQVLRNEGVLLLNEIETQQDLIDLFERVEKASFGKIIWHNEHKLCPFLKTKDYESAFRVAATLLAQHMSAFANLLHHLSPEQFYDSFKSSAEMSQPNLIDVYDHLSVNDYDWVEQYLSYNYTRNVHNAKLHI